MHLKPEEFVDLADGTRAEASFPHLAVCDACRRQLIDVRTTLGAIGAAGDAVDALVPEPPPFFWTQFQQRVASAVAAEANPGLLGRLLSFVTPRALVPLAAAATVAFLVVSMRVDRGRSAAPPIPEPPRSAASVGGNSSIQDLRFVELMNDALDDDDPSLQLVADLAGSIDLESASEVGLTPRGTADHALTHLDQQELRELQRLLKAELGT